MSEESKLDIKIFNVDLSKVIKVKDYYLPLYKIYVNGYVYKNTQKPAYENRKLTNYYYICDICKEKKCFSRLRKFLHKKNEYGNCCQKCVTKLNTQKESFKEKERIATKKSWENGAFDNLIKSGALIEWGRKNCRNMLDKNEEEKRKIAAKKIETWLKHTDEEKKEINFKRTKHFLENYKKSGCKPKFIPDKRFSTKEWYNIRTKIINRDCFTCQKCKKILKKSDLSVHHLIPYRFCQEDKEENLISLCKKCHGRVERFLEKNCILEDNKIDLEKELNFIYENSEENIEENN